ncbi:MAG: hypothetical protein V4539_23170 [Bacteroidota bacterium]
MAKVTKAGLNGAIGPLVFYTMNGKSYARSAPGPQSRKLKAKLQPQRNFFGKISSLSSAMAGAIRGELNCPFGLHAYNALRGWVFRQYKIDTEQGNMPLHINLNELCELNDAASLRQLLKAGISVADTGGGNLSVSIESFNPAKDMKVPAGAEWINLKLICARAEGGQTAELHFVRTIAQKMLPVSNKNLPAFEMELPTAGKKGSLVCLVLALEFRSNENSGGIINNPSFLPAAGIALGKLG